MNAADLFHATPRPRDACAEARAWLLDCFSEPDEVAEIRSLNWVGIIAAVERLHEGGWAGFRATQLGR